MGLNDVDSQDRDRRTVRMNKELDAVLKRLRSDELRILIIAPALPDIEVEPRECLAEGCYRRTKKLHGYCFKHLEMIPKFIQLQVHDIEFYSFSETAIELPLGVALVLAVENFDVAKRIAVEKRRKHE